MKGHLTFLGTGSSIGVPLIGCTCAICQSESSFNKRLRSSVYIEYHHRRFLIDAGPDFRQQALTYQLSKLDAVLITHAHYDHIGGFDDLRPLYFERETPLPILVSSDTKRDLLTRYAYIFNPKKPTASKLHLEVLPQEFGEITLANTSIKYVTYEQSGMQVNGFRFGDLAYLTDLHHFSSDIYAQLKGVRYLILSAIRFTSSPMHLTIDQAIDFSRKIQPEKTWLMHLSHDLDYFHTNAYLPPTFQLAYDGLKIDFE